MREGRQYHCPQCLATSPTGTTCDACAIPMIDEHGNPPLRPLAPPSGDPSDAWGIGGLAGIAGTVLGVPFGLVGLAAGPVLFAGVAATLLVAQRFRVAGRRRRARELMDRAGAVARIAGAAPGLVRIHGKVKVLGGQSYAAYERSPGDRRCWRMVVHDGSGPAVVDDDCFEIWRHDLLKPGGTVTAGAEIDVIGRAFRRPAPDPELVGALRDSSVLCFEGTPDSPLLLLV